MTYFLLDQPNPHGPHFYAQRQRPVLACVVHVTAGLQGRPAGSDRSAERTALYAASTPTKVSWHSGSDRDSHLELLPDSHVAFHCKGYNSVTIGHEISKTDVTWADEDPVWVTETLQQAADCLRPRLLALGIPIQRTTRRQLDRAMATGSGPVGLIGHDVLDPDRRRDPGDDFPWARFLQLLAPPSVGSSPPSPNSTDKETDVTDEQLARVLLPLLERQTIQITGGRRVRTPEGTVVDPDTAHVSNADVVTALERLGDRLVTEIRAGRTPGAQA